MMAQASSPHKIVLCDRRPTHVEFSNRTSTAIFVLRGTTPSSNFVRLWAFSLTSLRHFAPGLLDTCRLDHWADADYDSGTSTPGGSA